jgi:hypothetical protein
MALTKLINFGCSFAHGYGGVQQGDIYESIGFKLAKEFKLEYVDKARNGNNNEAILRNIREYFYNNNDDAIALIGWTNSLRREYIGWNLKNNSAEWIDYREIPYQDSIFFKAAQKFIGTKKNNVMVEFNERPNRPLAYIEHIEYRKCSLILQAQEFLKNRKIPYLMYHACGNEQNITFKDTKKIIQLIEKKYFHDYNGTPMNEWVLQNPGHSIPDTHPNEKGYNAWFDKLKPMFVNIIKK